MTYAKYLMQDMYLNIKDPIPVDDKSRIHEYIDIIENTSSSIVSKYCAIKFLGLICQRYGYNILEIFDAVSCITDNINSDITQIKFESLRSCYILMKHGGYDEIKQFIPLINELYKSDSEPLFIKDICSRLIRYNQLT